MAIIAHAVRIKRHILTIMNPLRAEANTAYSFQVYSGLLLCPQNRVLCHLGDSELDDSLSRNLDLLLCLRIEAHTSLPFLLYELAKAGQDEFAFLFDRFVGEVAERVEEYSSGLLVGLSGCSERGLKFSLGHL